MSSSWHHILAISPAEKIGIYRVDDNGGTVNTSTSAHILVSVSIEIIGNISEDMFIPMNFWSVGDRKRVFNTGVLICRHDMSSGLQ